MLFPVKGSDLAPLNTAVDSDPQPRRRARDRRARRAAPGQHDRREPARRQGPPRPRTSVGEPRSCGSARCSAPYPVADATTPRVGRDHNDDRATAARPRPARRAQPRSSRARPRRRRARRSPGHPDGERTIATTPIVAAVRDRPTVPAATGTTVAGRRRPRPPPHPHHGTERPSRDAQAIKQSPPDTDAAQQKSCCPIAKKTVVLRARAGARHRQERGVGQHRLRLDDSRSGRANVHFKNNDFLTKIAKPLVGQAGRDRARRSGAVGAEDQPRHHRPRRPDHRQLHAGRGEQPRARARVRRRCRSSSTAKQTVESVSPTLGKDQLHAGIVAGLIGLALVAIYMLLFYRLLGLVVIAGLVLTGMLFFTCRVVPVGACTGSRSRSPASPASSCRSVSPSTRMSCTSSDSKTRSAPARPCAPRSSPGSGGAFRTIVAADLVSLLGAVVLYAVRDELGARLRVLPRSVDRCWT